MVPHGSLASPGPLTSGEVIEVGGIEMMFVLPIDLSPLNIKDQYLRRAGILKSEPPASAGRQTRHPLPSGDEHPSSPQGKGVRGGLQKPLAPAPPDYKRPGTPPSARARGLGLHRSPYVEGAVMMSTSDVDLSLDENRHIKPQYSYAQMITQAIINTQEEKLNLSGIYNFIMNHYSYYKYQPASGWQVSGKRKRRAESPRPQAPATFQPLTPLQNSIRHNLSLNKAFEKVARSTDEPGKGMKWQLVADVREEMIRSAYRGGRGGHRRFIEPILAQPTELHHSRPKGHGSPRPNVGAQAKSLPVGIPPAAVGPPRLPSDPGPKHPEASA